jgi:hypothetical protein
LLHSRKFWLLVLDTVLSLVTFIVTNHLAPDLAAEIIALIAIIQPLWIMVIKGITDEDVADKGSLEWANMIAADIVKEKEEGKG